MSAPNPNTTPRWLRSLPIEAFAAAGNIDAENGIIPEVVMAREGEARGHGFHIDEEFIDDLVAYDTRYFSIIGLKSRFGHPNASEETMGKQLGVFFNFRKRKGNDGKMEAIADLHLLDAAENSPTHPGMKSWVMQMAQERPDFIMSSIVFQPGYFYQRRENGRKHKLEPNPNYWLDGEMWLNFQPDLGNIYASLGEHYFTDLVESGAVTDRLLSTSVNPHMLVSQMDEFLDQHPQLKEFAQANPDKVLAFLNRLGINPKPKPSLKMSLKEMLFGKEKPETDNTLSPEDVAELRQKMTDAECALTKAATDLQALQAEVNQLKVSLQEKDTELATAKARVTELEAKAAALHTEGRTEGDGTTDDGKPWESLGINQRAAQIAASRKK